MLLDSGIPLKHFHSGLPTLFVFTFICKNVMLKLNRFPPVYTSPVLHLLSSNYTR